jgi:hypothetical protein
LSSFLSLLENLPVSKLNENKTFLCVFNSIAIQIGKNLAHPYFIGIDKFRNRRGTTAFEFQEFLP